MRGRAEWLGDVTILVFIAALLVALVGGEILQVLRLLPAEPRPAELRCAGDVLVEARASGVAARCAPVPAGVRR